MADVFAAHDRRDNLDVAVKILRSNVARDQESLARFRHEAKVQRMVDHRNVAKLYAAGVDGGMPYLAMELLRGKSLLTVLRKLERVPMRYATSFTYQALQGLAATHEKGILHRDLKPANLMLEPSPGPVERVVLIDFGFASLGAATGLTGLGMVVGSLSYLAPERLRGEIPDDRADVYGMGIILYELLVGEPPFTGEDAEIMRGHTDIAPIPPTELAADAEISPALEAVILRALEKRPDDRWPSAIAMADALEAAVHGG